MSLDNLSPKRKLKVCMFTVLMITEIGFKANTGVPKNNTFLKLLNFVVLRP